MEGCVCAVNPTQLPKYRQSTQVRRLTVCKAFTWASGSLHVCRKPHPPCQVEVRQTGVEVKQSVKRLHRLLWGRLYLSTLGFEHMPKPLWAICTCPDFHHWHCEHRRPPTLFFRNVFPHTKTSSFSRTTPYLIAHHICYSLRPNQDDSVSVQSSTYTCISIFSLLRPPKDQYMDLLHSTKCCQRRQQKLRSVQQYSFQFVLISPTTYHSIFF